MFSDWKVYIMVINGKNNPTSLNTVDTSIWGIDVETWLNAYLVRFNNGQRWNDDKIYEDIYLAQGNGFPHMSWKKRGMTQASAGMTQRQFDIKRIESAIRTCVRTFDILYQEAVDDNNEIELIRLKSMFVNKVERASRAGLIQAERNKVVLEVARRQAMEIAEQKAKLQLEMEEKKRLEELRRQQELETAAKLQSEKTQEQLDNDRQFANDVMTALTETLPVNRIADVTPSKNGKKATSAK